MLKRLLRLFTRSRPAAVALGPVKHLGVYATPRLHVHVLELIPPMSEKPKQICLGFESHNTASFPITVLTLEGRLVEMVEVNDVFRCKGIGLEILRFAADFADGPLYAGLIASESGKGLVARASRAGIVSEDAFPDDDSDD